MQPPATQSIPTLSTERMILRGPTLDDFDAFGAMWADEAVIRHILPEPRSAEACWARLLEMSGHWTMLGFGYWIVEARDDGRFIGQAGFGNFHRTIEPPLGDRPEAGWVFRSPEHGRGLGTEAVQCIVDWADANLDAPETVCIFDPAHTVSMRLAAKVGYAPQHIAEYDGKPTQVMMRARAAS